MSLKDPRRGPTVYLLPEREKKEEARERPEEVCSQIFEAQLDASVVFTPW